MSTGYAVMLGVAIGAVSNLVGTIVGARLLARLDRRHRSATELDELDELVEYFYDRARRP